MYLNKEDLNFLLENLGLKSSDSCKSLNPGGIVYDSTQMSKQLVILTEGKARIIDHTKTFSSQTVTQ